METYWKAFGITEKDVCEILDKMTEKTSIEIIEDRTANETTEQYAVIRLSKFGFDIDKFKYHDNLQKIKTAIMLNESVG